MDSTLLIAAGFSFVLGLLGYFIVRFWIKPIGRYTAARRKLNHELTRYLEIMETTGTAGKKALKRNTELKNARRHSMVLASCYREDIPYWYKLMLDSRGESPVDALNLITNLARIRDAEQRKDHIGQARKKLGIK